MSAINPQTLRTNVGNFPLQEYHVHLAGRDWTILHVGAMLSLGDESRYVGDASKRLPYGVALWPAAIALAHHIASRGKGFRGRRVLELGAGTGLPGLVAASLGAQVVQTDQYELVLSSCRRNARRNKIHSVQHRLADWTKWADAVRYDWILGSDILYGDVLHPHLRRIFETNLAPGGRLLLADPFREPSIRLLEAMESEGWSVSASQWNVGEESAPRPMAVFELTRT